MKQADQIILECDNLKTNYGLEIEDPQVLTILDSTKMPKKAIQGTPWFSILSNPEYTEAFAYIGAFIPEREKLIKRGYAMDGT